MTATAPSSAPSAAHSAAPTSPAPVRRPDPQAPVPLGRLVDVETRKTVDTRSGLSLVVSVAVLVAGVVAVLGVWGADDEVTFASFTSFNSFPLRLLLPLVAVLAVTSEWSQRGALTTFALVPRRGRVVGAKALAALLVTVAATALTFLLSAAGTVAAAAARGIDPVWDLPADLAARLVLANVVAVAFGFTVAVVIRASAPALVVFLGTMLVVPMVSAVAASLFGWWAQHGAWLDLTWSMQFVTSPQITGEQWAQVAASAVLWIGLPLVLGLRRVLRVEVR